MKNMSNKILVIDDDREFLNALIEVLKEEGYSVDGTTTLKEGIEFYQNNTYTCVLMDIYFPRDQSWGVIEMLKSIKKERYIPIILMTGYSRTGDFVLTSLYHGDGYIKKPFSKEELISKIEESIKRAEIIETLSKKGVNKGKLSSTITPDVLKEVAYIKKFSGFLVIKNDTGGRVVFFFRKGELIEIEKPSKERINIIKESLEWKKGEYRFYPSLITNVKISYFVPSRIAKYYIKDLSLHGAVGTMEVFHDSEKTVLEFIRGNVYIKEGKEDENYISFIKRLRDREVDVRIVWEKKKDKRLNSIIKELSSFEEGGIFKLTENPETDVENKILNIIKETEDKLNHSPEFIALKYKNGGLLIRRGKKEVVWVYVKSNKDLLLAWLMLKKLAV